MYDYPLYMWDFVPTRRLVMRMTSQYQYFLAGPQHDAELRKLLVQTPMAGAISISFQREPSYFDALPVEGCFSQVLAVREKDQERLSGMGTRSIKPCYVNGQVQPVGYLSNLRVHQADRNRLLVGRGYRFLHDLHQDGRTKLYLTTIAHGNPVAFKTLTGRRAQMPLYQPAGLVHTFVYSRVNAKSNSYDLPDRAIHIRKGRREDLPAVMDFWQREGARYQFFPYHQKSDLGLPGGLLSALDVEDILLAFRNEQLVGTLGLWDQSRLKQYVINGYGGVMRWLRPIYNGYARIVNRTPLPPKGSQLKLLTAAVPMVEADDAKIFEALLHTAIQQIDLRKQDYLMVACHESSPLLRVLKKIRGVSYLTHLYFVCWTDGVSMLQTLDNRPIYVELGSL